MIRCTPRGICSWNFFLDADGHHATLEFNWVGEQGDITVDGTLFEVRKHGVFSGHWTLDRAGREAASAQKSAAFTRTFEIQDDYESLVLRAESAFGRSFRIERSGGVIATVCPDHAFTRRATIEILAQKWNFTTISLVIFKIFSSSLVILVIPPHVRKPLLVGRRPSSFLHSRGSRGEGKLCTALQPSHGIYQSGIADASMTPYTISDFGL